jgi:hypothetical protein
MIDTMFWPFTFKAAAKRHNCLLLNSNGFTPNALLHGVPLNTIPVKTFHTLFCPVYVLDTRVQNAGGPGPPKWEPRSWIGIYLGHSPFHAGSVALVFNPCTSRVSPQYHIVFNNTFSTIPYMDAGTVPPHWEDLLQHSSEKATDKDFDLAQEWMDMTKRMPGQPNEMAGRPITDPFAVITEDSNNPPANATQAASASDGRPPDVPTQLTITDQVMRTLEGGNKHASTSSTSALSAAANLNQKHQRCSPSDDARANHWSDFGSDGDTAASTRSQLMIPQCVNLHKAGLH